jgi:hypothetical protein
MPRPDERPDDGLIHAWLDGELGAEEAARVERLVAEDAEWAAAAAEARGLMAASTRILGALDVVAGDVIPRGGSAAGTFAPMIDGSRVPKTHVTRWAVPTWMRVAAGVALVAGVGYLGLERSGDRSAPSAKLDAARETRSDVASSASRAPAPTAAMSAPGTAERSARQNAPVARNESDFSTRDAGRDAPAAAPIAPPATESATASAAVPATAIGSAASPPPSASQTVVAPAGVTVATGVAGGIASGTVSRAVVESKEARTTAEIAPEREARAKTMQRALTPAPSAPVERALDSPSALAAQGARMADRVAESAVANTGVSGCWHTRTNARVDSIQTSLRIIRSIGDTLVLALTPTGAEARVVRESETVLRGSARGVSGPSATFRAERMACTP